MDEEIKEGLDGLDRLYDAFGSIASDGYYSNEQRGLAEDCMQKIYCIRDTVYEWLELEGKPEIE